jgi:hypothetical protein
MRRFLAIKRPIEFFNEQSGQHPACGACRVTQSTVLLVLFQSAQQRTEDAFALVLKRSPTDIAWLECTDRREFLIRADRRGEHAPDESF